MLEQI
jgi:hypothetical protein